jgi:hypothetical protein
MAKSRKKNCFLVASDNFFYKNGPNNLLRGLSSSLDIRPYIPPTCGPLNTFLDPLIRGAQMAPKWPEKHKKKLFSGCFGPFPLKEWA